MTEGRSVKKKISSNANFSEIRTRIVMESDLWLYLHYILIAI